jgi:cytochrome c biogenesis protein CcmG, thiol:disulfide interchange protein DsbE
MARTGNVVPVVAALMGLGALGASYLGAARERARAPASAPCEALGPKPLPASRPPGAEAPDFELRDLSGKTWSLAALRGQPALVAFWASWCVPCADEMPALEALARQVGDRARVLAISTDEDWESVKRFFRRGTDLPVVLDRDRTVAARFGSEGIPETFLLDGAGRIRHFFHQARWDAPEAAACLDSLR